MRITDLKEGEVREREREKRKRERSLTAQKFRKRTKTVCWRESQREAE